MTRWEALVRFDDEIREAAFKLLPFGPIWIDRLGEAFFALGEDRKYLPNIVDRLIEQATREVQDAERAEAQRWLKEIISLPNGEQANKESIAVLIELRARDFHIGRDSGAITIAKSGKGTSYVRSNEDILRIGQVLLKTGREN